MKLVITAGMERAEWNNDKLRFIGDRNLVKFINAVCLRLIHTSDGINALIQHMQDMGYTVEYVPDDAQIPDEVVT